MSGNSKPIEVAVQIITDAINPPTHEANYDGEWFPVVAFNLASKVATIQRADGATRALSSNEIKGWREIGKSQTPGTK